MQGASAHWLYVLVKGEGGIETSGVDVQFNWNIPMGAGHLNLNSVINFLSYYRDQVSPADKFVDSTGTLARGGQYDFRTFTTATFSQGDWSAGLRHRFLPSIEDASAGQGDRGARRRSDRPGVDPLMDDGDPFTDERRQPACLEPGRTDDTVRLRHGEHQAGILGV